MQRIEISKLLLIPILLLCGCAGSNRWSTEIEWKDFSRDATPDSQDYPDSPAVILLDEGFIHIHVKNNSGYSSFTRKKIIKVLKPEGKEYADISIPYSSQSTITKIKARTISPEGKITVLDPKEIFDVNLYPKWMIYSDIRAKVLTLPAVDVGSIIEFSYTKTVPSLSLWDNWEFQSLLPTLISRLKLVVPKTLKFEFTDYHIQAEPEKKVGPLANETTYIWEKRNIPALEIEPSMPSLARGFQRIEFTPLFAKTWKGIGKWVWLLNEPRLKVEDELQVFTKELIKEAKSEKEKLEQIFNFVQSKIRYVSISIGIGSYQPHFVSQTFENRFGDCKDMTALIVAMAKSADIKAWPVLISTFQNGEVDTMHVSHTQFNHAIACAELADEELVWMDATDKECPFGELPWYDQERWVLSVRDSGTINFLQTPGALPEKNATVQNWNLELGVDGSLIGHGAIRYDGASEHGQRRTLKNLQNGLVKQWFAENLGQLFPSAQLENFSIINRRHIEQELEIHLDFKAPNYFNKNSELFMLRGSLFSRNNYDAIFNSPQRKNPVHLRFLESNIDTIYLKLPETLRLKEIPQNQFVANEMGRYEIRFYKMDNNLMITRKFQTRQSKILIYDYPEWFSFLQKVTQNDRSQIIIELRPNRSFLQTTDQ